MPRGYKYEIDIDDDNNNSVNYTVVIVRIITIIAIIQAYIALQEFDGHTMFLHDCKFDLKLDGW